MLPNTPAEVAGDADVEGAVAFAREDIHARAFLHHALIGNSPINAVIKILTSMLRTHLSSFPRTREPSVFDVAGSRIALRASGMTGVD